jgi:glycosyltransferase involved in cell wall biosynthesis
MLDKNVNISVVMTVRDKLQFKQAVQSVLIQEMKEDFELIVVDYGSIRQNVKQELESFGPNYGKAHSVRLLTVPKIEQYNRCVSNNIGFRWALGRFILTLDSDVVIPENYLQSLLKRVKKNICIRCVGKESATNTYRKWCGCGIMVIPFEYIFKITGYDESFSGYGEEDLDFKERLERSGCKIITMNRPAWTHLTHSNVERAQAQFCARFLKAENPNKRKRFLNKRFQRTSVNAKTWGSSIPVIHTELK